MPPSAASCWMTIGSWRSEEFDLGMAVAMEDDRLATAVITNANTLALAGFR